MSSAHRPEELHRALADAFNTRQIENVMALYEGHASLVPRPGIVVSGGAALREALRGFLAVPGLMIIETVYAVESDGLALTRSAWSIRDGNETQLHGAGTEIMRRQPDGSWLFAVDHPFGAAAGPTP